MVDRQARRLLLPCFVVLSGLVWILRGGVGWTKQWSGVGSADLESERLYSLLYYYSVASM